MALLQQAYPWTAAPFVASAPMRAAAGPHLAAAVSQAGGLGFIGSGTDLSTLKADLETAALLLSGSSAEDIASYEKQTGHLPIGVGVICHYADISLLEEALRGPHVPCAVWLFAADRTADLKPWRDAVRRSSSKPPRIWIQIGGVQEALQVVEESQPSVLVVQGIDAGGHGLEQGAGIVSLLPEVSDALQERKARGEIQGDLPALVATGGLMDGRGVAAALTLGADGACLGTRYLASEETTIPNGHRQEVLRARDGGQTTARSKVYDTLRGTAHWPERYGGRGILNQSFYDWHAGMKLEENQKLYNEAMAQAQGPGGFGPQGRLTAYAGTGVGLVTKIQSAADITQEVRQDARRILSRLALRVQ